jgi:hypothetical protein
VFQNINLIHGSFVEIGMMILDTIGIGLRCPVRPVPDAAACTIQK